MCVSQFGFCLSVVSGTLLVGFAFLGLVCLVYPLLVEVGCLVLGGFWLCGWGEFLVAFWVLRWS